MAQNPTSVFNSDETLLDGQQTRAFFGGRSEMWIARRKKERQREIARGGVPFPLGRFIGNREYFTLGELRHYRDSRPHVRVVHAPPPPRAPKGKRWKRGDKVATTAASSTNPES